MQTLRVWFLTDFVLKQILQKTTLLLNTHFSEFELSGRRRVSGSRRRCRGPGAPACCPQSSSLPPPLDGRAPLPSPPDHTVFSAFRVAPFPEMQIGSKVPAWRKSHFVASFRFFSLSFHRESAL